MELMSIDVSKLTSTTNKDLMAMADSFGIKYNAESLNRGEVIAALKEKVAMNVATNKNIKVVFHNTPNSPKEVVVVLNGRNFTYPKDVAVNVPEEVLAVIDDAFEWVVEQDEFNRRVKRKYQSQTYTVVRD